MALVLLSTVGFALLAWVQQNLDTTYRLRDFYVEQDARLNALAWVRTLNPMESPEGEIKHANLRYAWKATPLSQPIAQTGYPQGIGKHEVALYTMTISVFRNGESQAWFSEKITLIGSRRSGTGTATTPFG